MHNSFRSRLLGISALAIMSGAVNFMTPEGDGSIVELDSNLDSYDDYQILPKGNYRAVCETVEKRVSDNGNEFYYTNWRIMPDNYPADYDHENAPEGTLLNYSRIQVPTSTDRRSITNVKRLMRAIGLDLKTKVIDHEQWVGKEAKLVVGWGTFNGERRAQIDKIESLDA